MPMLPTPNPAKTLLETRVTEADPGEAQRTGRRLGDRITCGEIIASDLATHYANNNQRLDVEVRGQLDQYEFLVLRFVCTLHPDNLSAVSWFDFMVTFAYPAQLPRTGIFLTQVSPAARVLVDSDAPPIAYDLYPQQVVDTTQVEHTVKISPQLKFGDVEVGIGEDALTLKYQTLQPRITAFGKQQSEIYWRYTPGNADDVASGDKQMAVVVRRRRGVPVQGTVRLRGRGWRYGVIPDLPDAERLRFYF